MKALQTSLGDQVLKLTEAHGATVQRVDALNQARADLAEEVAAVRLKGLRRADCIASLAAAAAASAFCYLAHLVPKNYPLCSPGQGPDYCPDQARARGQLCRLQQGAGAGRDRGPQSAVGGGGHGGGAGGRSRLVSASSVGARKV